MKTRFLNWGCLVLAIVVPIVLVCANAAADAPATRNTVAQMLQELQKQGFKTDLTNFDFSTSPESQVREEVLIDTTTNRHVTPFYDHPDLMEPAGSNKVIVVWQQNSLRRQNPSWPDNSYVLTWEDFRQAINQNKSQIDAACAAILSGPVQFYLDATDGNSMRLPHLALLKDLTQTLDDRAMLALHDGNRGEAWTNLLAATRLVTTWNPEPARISHQTRFDNARLVLAATWQALQTNGWTDDQLVRLQQEWESADFLTQLPEIQAFRRASDLAALEQVLPPPTPPGAVYDDEEHMLLYYCAREMDYHQAVQAGTWMQMRQYADATNDLSYTPKYYYRGPAGMVLWERHTQEGMRQRLEGPTPSFLAQAAEAEAERRVMVTAISLERYNAKYGHYPETLQALAPDFLKSVPLNFMNGEQLHYRVADGNFLLYSVGLDGVDNGGKVPVPPTQEEKYARLTNPNVAVPESDIVWPLSALSPQIAALRKHQAEMFAEQMAAVQARGRAAEEEGERIREAAMTKFLADNPSLGVQPMYQGKHLSDWVNKVGRIEEYNGAPEDAVAAIRAIGPKAVPFLLAWMPHPGQEQPVEGLPDWSDIDIAWWALGTEGKSAIPTLGHLISLPQRSMDDYSVWTESAKAISYLGPDAIVPMLTVATNMEGQHDLWELLHNFENLGTNGAPAVPALVHWANDPDYWVRDGVVSALGGIGERPDLSVPVLTNALLHDSDGMVRRDAADALGSFANDSDAVLPLLIKTVKDPPDWQTRGGALSGLGKIQNKPEVVVPVIAPFLYDDNNVIQRTAAYALRDLGSEAGYRVLLQATNASGSWPGIGDIIYQVQEKMHQEHSK